MHRGIKIHCTMHFLRPSNSNDDRLENFSYDLSIKSLCGDWGRCQKSYDSRPPILAPNRHFVQDLMKKAPGI